MGSGAPGVLDVFPQAKPATEGVNVVAGAAARRQCFQFMNVAAAQLDLVGFEADETGDRQMGLAVRPGCQTAIVGGPRLNTGKQDEQERNFDR